jgi:hypothetical protein
MTIKLTGQPLSNIKGHQRTKIFSKNFRVQVDGQRLSIFEAEARDLIWVVYDKHLNCYSFIVKKTGEVTSHLLSFGAESWPEWLKEHMTKLKIKHKKLEAT